MASELTKCNFKITSQHSKKLSKQKLTSSSMGRCNQVHIKSVSNLQNIIINLSCYSNSLKNLLSYEISL